MKTSQKRARTGGEVGANGEWYEGGKFIATTRHAKSQAKPRFLRKYEIAPFTWVTRPNDVSEDAMPIFGRLGGLFPFCRDTQTFSVGDTFSKTFCYDPKTRHHHCPTPKQQRFYRDLIKQFNSGQRWSEAALPSS